MAKERGHAMTTDINHRPKLTHAQQDEIAGTIAEAQERCLYVENYFEESDLDEMNRELDELENFLQNIRSWIVKTKAEQRR